MGGIGQNILREIKEQNDWENWDNTPIKEILEKVIKENTKEEEKKNTLIKKVKSELTEAAGKDFSQEEINSFLEWMKVEYRNYMLLTRENALSTLQKLKAVYGDYIPLVNVLENNIDEYASLQCFYIIAMDGVNVNA